MKKFKNIICSVLALSLTAVFANMPFSVEASESSSDRLSIVSSNFPTFDFVRAIVGDTADVKMLLKPGAESHAFEPSVDDIKTINNSELFVSVGGENEAWVDKILSSTDNKVNSVKLIDLVDTVNEEIVEGMEHEHHHDGEEVHKHHDGEEAHEHHDGEEAHEHHDGEEAHGHHDGEESHEHHDGEEGHSHNHEEVDEHVWTSPKKAIEIVNKLEERISELKPDSAEIYRKNADEYISKLETLDKSFKDIVSAAKRKTFVFGDRFPLRYFADEFGLDYYAAFSGCSTQTEASAATVKFLVDKVKAENIPVVFKIELSNGRIAEAISKETGAKVLEFNACHNVSKEQFEQGLTYVDLMQNNLEVLKEALN